MFKILKRQKYPKPPEIDPLEEKIAKAAGIAGEITAPKIERRVAFMDYGRSEPETVQLGRIGSLGFDGPLTEGRNMKKLPDGTVVSSLELARKYAADRVYKSPTNNPIVLKPFVDASGREWLCVVNGRHRALAAFANGEEAITAVVMTPRGVETDYYPGFVIPPASLALAGLSNHGSQEGY